MKKNFYLSAILTVFGAALLLTFCFPLKLEAGLRINEFVASMSKQDVPLEKLEKKFYLDQSDFSIVLPVTNSNNNITTGTCCIYHTIDEHVDGYSLAVHSSLKFEPDL